MKTLLIIAALFMSASVFAQPATKEDLQVIRDLFGKSKKDLVSKYMNVPTDKADAFWKVYDEFEGQRKELADKKMNLIADYANNYTTLNDAKADELAKATFSNTMAYEKLNKKYYGKMKKVIGATEAAKYMQLETYIQTAVRSEIQDAIPFIGEIDRTIKH